MIIPGFKLNIWPCREVGQLRKIYHNNQYIMLETIKESDEHITFNLCYYKKNRFHEDELEDLLYNYDNYIKPFGILTKMEKVSGKCDFDNYSLQYDIPDDVLLYLKLNEIYSDV